MGREPIDDEVASSWVGNGAPVLIRRAMGPDASEADVERALAYFLAYYREHMLDNTVLYPGVRDGLDQLREAGLKMAVLTNKPVRFSQALVAGLGIGAPFFSSVWREQLRPKEAASGGYRNSPPGDRRGSGPHVDGRRQPGRRSDGPECGRPVLRRELGSAT